MKNIKELRITIRQFPLLVCIFLSFYMMGCSEPLGFLSRPTSTLTATPSPLPTSTPSPTFTPTVTPTLTPTPTPVVGTFDNPFQIGQTVTVPEVPLQLLIPGKDEPENMELAILDVKTGSDANALAQQQLDWLTYKEPISGQDYLAVHVQLKMLNYDDNNEAESIYPAWSVVLRYSDGGDNIWAVNLASPIAQGYPPIQGETWLFFLIKANSKPLLYFQTELMSGEQVLDSNNFGAYYLLFNN